MMLIKHKKPSNYNSPFHKIIERKCLPLRKYTFIPKVDKCRYILSLNNMNMIYIPRRLCRSVRSALMGKGRPNNLSLMVDHHCIT